MALMPEESCEIFVLRHLCSVWMKDFAPLYDISIAFKKIYTVFVISISQRNNYLHKLLRLLLMLY